MPQLLDDEFVFILSSISSCIFSFTLSVALAFFPIQLGWCVCVCMRPIHFFFVVLLNGSELYKQRHNRRHDTGEYKLIDLKYIGLYMLGEYAENSQYTTNLSMKEMIEFLM